MRCSCFRVPALLPLLMFSQFHKQVKAAFSTSTQQEACTAKRILCYGDSLTAGTSPPLLETFPYAPHLQRELQKTLPAGQVMVRHRGLPGWTASQMVEAQSHGQAGLKTAIQGIQDPSLTLVIILAGTNDLAYTQDASAIVESVVDLHKLCHAEDIPHTLAIGIPSSGYQRMVKEAAAVANEVNLGLQRFCEENSQRATFVPFPFPYIHQGENWAPDGLHFSPTGYKELGEKLAPVVTEIVSSTPR